jgi:hypothetical protein
VGTHLATRLPERGLRPALGIVLLTSGLTLLTKAGVDVPVGVIVAVPLVLAAAAASPASVPLESACFFAGCAVASGLVAASEPFVAGAVVLSAGASACGEVLVAGVLAALFGARRVVPVVARRRGARRGPVCACAQRPQTERSTAAQIARRIEHGRTLAGCEWDETSGMINSPSESFVNAW